MMVTIAYYCYSFDNVNDDDDDDDDDDEDEDGATPLSDAKSHIDHLLATHGTTGERKMCPNTNH